MCNESMRLSGEHIHVLRGGGGGVGWALDGSVGTVWAMIPGCCAEIVFSLCVSLALLTSRGWTVPLPASAAWERRGLRLWAFLITGLVFGQIILGALLR